MKLGLSITTCAPNRSSVFHLELINNQELILIAAQFAMGERKVLALPENCWFEVGNRVDKKNNWLFIVHAGEVDERQL